MKDKQKPLIYLFLILLMIISDVFHLIEMEHSFFITLSVPVFLLFLLYFKSMSPIFSGVAVGLTLVLSRTGFSVIEGQSVIEALFIHAPVAVYFTIFGLLFWLFYLDRFYSNPVYIGLYAVILDTASSFSELAIRNALGLTDASFSVMSTVLLLAILRNFFVMGFFMLILYSQQQTKAEEEKKQSDHIFLLLSDLYAESVQLRNSIKRAEDITGDLYYLSKTLKREEKLDLSKRILDMAGKVHDFKKDHQRIFASLDQIIKDQKKNEHMNICELLEIVIKSNKAYAVFLQKSVVFSVSVDNKKDSVNSFVLLSVLNNLISNAIESISETGTIDITIKNPASNPSLHILITDNGPGIPEEEQQLIFSPGFTTKFNDQGWPSNGIGLSYIQQSLHKLKGSISLVESIPNHQTCFSVHMPRSLSTEGDV